jgi:hypothetical protein
VPCECASDVVGDPLHVGIAGHNDNIDVAAGAILAPGYTALDPGCEYLLHALKHVRNSSISSA